MKKITFVPLNDYEKELLTKKEVVNLLERRIRKMFMTDVKMRLINKKYKEITI